MPVPVVDCHSHIFNAEDLPIDGFIRRLSPLPSLLTGVISVPLDRLTAWAAPGSAEIGHIIARLTAAVAPDRGEEGAAALELPEPREELISDAELESRLIELWPLAESADPTAFESVSADVDDLIAQRIAHASPEQLEELAAWEAEWIDERDESRALGPVDILRRAARLRVAVLRFVAALRLVAQHRFRIAARLSATYPQVGLFVPALVDFSHTTRDEPATSVQTQVAIHSLVAKLSVVGGIPGAAHVRIHPLVGFCPYREVKASELALFDVDHGRPNEYIPYADPRTATAEDRYRPGLRYDAARAKTLRKPVGPWHTARLDIGRVTRSLDIVRHAVELGGFAGVKLYPPAGFLPIGNVSRFGERVGEPLDTALRALYAYCDAEDVPILTHAARSNGFEDGYDDLASPSGWQRVLEEFPTLRICLGHFGHLHGIGDDAGSPSTTSWPMRFMALIDKYPNVYADVGNSRYGIDTAYRAQYDAFLAVLLGCGAGDDVHRKRRRRLMFGSDYWMNTIGAEYSGFLHSFSAGVEALVGPEARTWFMGGNALRWLGITNEQELPDIGNSNRQRLVAFYDDHPRPEWLL